MRTAVDTSRWIGIAAGVSASAFRTICGLGGSITISTGGCVGRQRTIAIFDGCLGTGAVSIVDGSVACVVGAVVGCVVGMDVSAGLEFLQPQPVNNAAAKTATSRRMLYFFILLPPNYMVSKVLLPNVCDLPWQK